MSRSSQKVVCCTVLRQRVIHSPCLMRNGLEHCESGTDIRNANNDQLLRKTSMSATKAETAMR